MVVVDDDDPAFTEGLALLLHTGSGGRAVVVGRTDHASDAVPLVRNCRADLALVELGREPTAGLQAISAIRRAEPAVQVVALSICSDDATAVAALRAGAEALLVRTADPRSLVSPLLTVLEGWSIVPADLLRQVLAGGPPRGQHGVVDALSLEQLRLWRLVAAGMTSIEIAETLHVSERTAKRLIAGLIRQLRVSSRMEAATLAGQVGLSTAS